MSIKIQIKPRIERGITKLWVPHNNQGIAFAYPSMGPNNYRNVGNHILNSNQEVPTGDYTPSLLHAAYCTSLSNEPEFQNIKDIMKNTWLWVFNRNLWTPEGVYVVQDLEAIGRSQPLDVKNLEKRLRNARETNGIRFSEDNIVRFAPKGSYRVGEHTPESLAKDCFIIASCGKEGAEKLGEVSSKFRNKPYVYGSQVNEGQLEQRVSAVGEFGERFRFRGDGWYADDNSHAFGVFK